MKKRLFGIIITLVLLIVGLSGCVESNIVIGKGEIRYIDLEGGFYGIVSEDDEHYDPVNLPLDFEEDGLRVGFKLKILENQSSFHMWGTIVEIIEIRKL